MTGGGGQNAVPRSCSVTLAGRITDPERERNATMATKDALTIGPDGFLQTNSGGFTAEFVNSVRTGLVEFPQITVICLRLYESGTADPATGHAGPETLGVQVRMSARAAREVARQLSDCADEIEGVRHPRQ